MNLDKVPKTLEECVELIILDMSVEDREFMKCNDSGVLHMSFGRWLRNNWSLWDRETMLVQWFVNTLGIVHADDLSSCILEAVRYKLRGQPFDAEKHVLKYKTHWMSQGINPKTMETLKTHITKKKDNK